MKIIKRIQITGHFQHGAYILEDGDVFTVDPNAQGMSRAQEYIMPDLIAQHLIDQKLAMPIDIREPVVAEPISWEEPEPQPTHALKDGQWVPIDASE